MRTHALLTAPALLTLALGACSYGDATDLDLDVGTLTEALSSAHVGELQGKIEITVDVSGMALNNCSSSLPSRCLQLCFRDDNCYPFVPGSGGPVFN